MFLGNQYHISDPSCGNTQSLISWLTELPTVAFKLLKVGESSVALDKYDLLIPGLLLLLHCGLLSSTAFCLCCGMASPTLNLGHEVNGF
jgi:hypothetical protein